MMSSPGTGPRTALGTPSWASTFRVRSESASSELSCTSMSGAWYLESRAGIQGPGPGRVQRSLLGSGLGSGPLRTRGFGGDVVSQEGQAEHRPGTGMGIRAPAGRPEDPPGLT